MLNLPLQPNALALDQLGRVTLSDEDLDAIISLDPAGLAGGTNPTCTGHNTGCTNNPNCNRSTNNRCTNSGGGCDSSSNYHCTNNDTIE